MFELACAIFIAIYIIPMMITLTIYVIGISVGLLMLGVDCVKEFFGINQSR